MSEAVPSQDPQNPKVHIEEGVMSDIDLKASIHTLNQVLATQVAKDTTVQVNLNFRIMHQG